MAKRGGKARGSKQLPLICEECGGPVEILREGVRVLARCEACGATAVALQLEPPPGEEAVRPSEQDLLQQVGEPAQALYEYLRRYLKAYGYAPTLREMKDGLGWSSANTVSHYLKQLETVGLIERDYAAARGIRMPHAA